jgi:hypothetical protein
MVNYIYLDEVDIDGDAVVREDGGVVKVVDCITPLLACAQVCGEKRKGERWVE